MSVAANEVFNTDNHVIDKFIKVVITIIGMGSMMVLIGCELLITIGLLGVKLAKKCVKIWWITIGVYV